MKLLICGGRHFCDYNLLESYVDKLLEELSVNFDDVEIISGGCTGADALGELYADRHNIPVTRFKPDWAAFGKAAGPIRNADMINYINSFDDKAVVAFASQNSRGTLNTISLAKKLNIPTYIYNYDYDSLAVELYEGIRQSESNFEVDWDKNLPEDIVYLDRTKCIHNSRFSGKLRYYGYKINKKSRKDSRDNFLKYIKNNIDKHDSLLELIDRCIADFYEISPIKHYDYLLKIPSSSKINDLLCDYLIKNFDNCDIIELTKKPAQAFEFDLDKFSKSFSGEYLPIMLNYLTKYAATINKKDKFSITEISPRYRRYIKPMIDLGDQNIDLNKNILIIDDTFTTGSTINMVLDTLETLGFTGNISILTLINNQ